MTRSGVPDYVLIPDGQGGLRMAPAGAAPPAAWASEPASIQPVALPAEEAPGEAEAGEADTAETPMIYQSTAPPPAPAPGRAQALAAGVCLLAVVLAVSLLRQPHAAAVRAEAAAPGQGLTVLPGAPHAEPAPAAPVPLPGVRAEVGPANPVPALAMKAPAAVAPPPSAPVTLAGAPPAAPVRLTAPAPAADAAETRGTAASAETRQADDNGCAGSPAERMVCADPELADFDREMRRDLRAASRAGVPLEDLRASQADFTRQREAAARRSPEALAEVYDQRIVELERMIADAQR